MRIGSAINRLTDIRAPWENVSEETSSLTHATTQFPRSAPRTRLSSDHHLDGIREASWFSCATFSFPHPPNQVHSILPFRKMADEGPHFLPLPQGMLIAQIEQAGTELPVTAVTTRTEAVCPSCGYPSEHIHSKYQRTGSRCSLGRSSASSWIKKWHKRLRR